MAEIARNSCNGTYGSQYTQVLGIVVNSQSIQNNSSNVTILYTNQNTAGTAGNYGYANPATISLTDANGSRSNYYENSSTDYRNGAVVTLGSWTTDVKHNSNGTLTLAVAASFSSESSSLSGGSVDGTYTLPQIPRYATVEQSLNSKTVNSIIIDWTSDSTIDYVKYSIDNGTTWNNVGSINAQSGSYTITGLNPNTKYNIKTQVRRKDSQLTTDSTALAVTTYDIGKISTLNNFNHGDNVIVIISNPSGSSLNLKMKVGETQILTRTVTSGSNTIIFSDEELDNLYKLYGSSNTLTAIFILTTANEYTDTKTCIITLTGNQKTRKNRCRKCS